MTWLSNLRLSLVLKNSLTIPFDAQKYINKNKNVYELETACGTCMFKMKGKGCVLAVKYNDSAYFIKGTNIDDHGDAHAKNGFCNAVKKARIQGELKDNIFWVTYFEVLNPKK